MAKPTNTGNPAARQPLTELQKRFLSRHICAWCEHRLDWPGCSDIYEKCTPRQQAARRRRALKTYRPREGEGV